MKHGRLLAGLVGAWLVLGPRVTAAQALPGEPVATPADAPPAATPPEPPPAEAATPAPAQAPATARPKIAVVIVGDPDEVALAMSARLHALVSADATLATVASDELRGALEGRARPEQDDGLSEVRRLRASLADDEEADRATLARLGARAGADVVAVVRRRGAGPEVVVFDVARRSWFTGRFGPSPGATEAQDARLLRLVGERAREALAARSRREGAAARPRVTGGRASRPARRTAPAAATRASPARASRSWIEQSWPYLAAAGIAGAFVALYFVGRDDGGHPFEVRFVRAETAPGTTP